MSKKRIFQILVSVALMAAMLYAINLSQVRELLVNANLALIALALAVATVDRIFMPTKWNLLLRAKKIVLSWFEAVKVYYTSSFLGFYLPATVGADAIRAYITSKRGDPASVISSILVERLIGLIALFLFGVLGALIFINFYATFEFDVNRLLYITATFAALAILGFALSLSEIMSRRILWISAMLSRIGGLKKIVRKLERLYRSYLEYRTSPGVLIIFFFLTLAENILPILRPFLVSLAFHQTIPLSFYFVLVPIMLVLIRLPISIDGFGIHEGVFIFFLGLYGIDPVVAFSIGLVNHVLFIIALLPGGIFYALDPGLQEARSRVAEEAPRTQEATTVPVD